MSRQFIFVGAILGILVLAGSGSARQGAAPIPVLPPPDDFAVTYGSFEHVLETSEWTPLERGVLEHKYYVKGVGNVRTIMVKGGSEEEHLVSITR
jgi:hypothetical protein